MDLIKHSQLLPEKPTAADTADWYRLGDSVEKHGRHMKRQAVAAEYKQRGQFMEAWYREVGLNPTTGRDLLQEARQVHMLDESVDAVDSFSKALPTARAAREYAKAEPEVREVIQDKRLLRVGLQ
jgi:plasmid stability protein